MGWETRKNAPKNGGCPEGTPPERLRYGMGSRREKQKQAMRYIAFAQPGPPEVLHLAEGPAPVAGPGGGLVRGGAAGVQPPHVLQRAGTYPPPPSASPILG